MHKKFIQCIGKGTFCLHPLHPSSFPTSPLKHAQPLARYVSTYTDLIDDKCMCHWQGTQYLGQPSKFNSDRVVKCKNSRIVIAILWTPIIRSMEKNLPWHLQMSNVIVPFVVALLLHTFHWSLPMEFQRLGHVGGHKDHDTMSRTKIYHC